MKRRIAVILVLSCSILAALAAGYIVYEKAKKPSTICKAPSINNSETTLPNNGPSKESIVNTLGNTTYNLQNRGLAARQGNWIYYNCNGLCKVMIDMKTGWKRLNWDSAQNINVVGDWIYYVKGGTLYKLKTDGSGKKELSNDYCFNVLVTTKWVFYISARDRTLYKMDLNGQNVIKLSNDTCMGFSFLEGWIYFGELDNSGGSALYKVDLDGNNKTIAKPEEFNLIVPQVNISCFNRSKDFTFYITPTSSELYKIKTDNNQQSKPEMICDFSKYTTSKSPLIIALDDFLLVYFDNFTDYDSYKVDFNGKIEKISE